jgi:hypothetical protein
MAKTIGYDITTSYEEILPVGMKGNMDIFNNIGTNIYLYIGDSAPLDNSDSILIPNGCNFYTYNTTYLPVYIRGDSSGRIKIIGGA